MTWQVDSKMDRVTLRMTELWRPARMRPELSAYRLPQSGHHTDDASPNARKHAAVSMNTGARGYLGTAACA